MKNNSMRNPFGSDLYLGQYHYDWDRGVHKVKHMYSLAEQRLSQKPDAELDYYDLPKVHGFYNGQLMVVCKTDSGGYESMEDAAQWPSHCGDWFRMVRDWHDFKESESYDTASQYVDACAGGNYGTLTLTLKDGCRLLPRHVIVRDVTGARTVYYAGFTYAEGSGAELRYCCHVDAGELRIGTPELEASLRSGEDSPIVWLNGGRREGWDWKPTPVEMTGETFFMWGVNPEVDIDSGDVFSDASLWDKVRAFPSVLNDGPVSEETFLTRVGWGKAEGTARLLFACGGVEIRYTPEGLRYVGQTGKGPDYWGDLGDRATLGVRSGARIDWMWGILEREPTTGRYCLTHAASLKEVESGRGGECDSVLPLADGADQEMPPEGVGCLAYRMNTGRWNEETDAVDPAFAWHLAGGREGPVLVCVETSFMNVQEDGSQTTLCLKPKPDGVVALMRPPNILVYFKRDQGPCLRHVRWGRLDSATGLYELEPDEYEMDDVPLDAVDGAFIVPLKRDTSVFASPSRGVALRAILDLFPRVDGRAERLAEKYERKREREGDVPRDPEGELDFLKYLAKICERVHAKYDDHVLYGLHTSFKLQQILGGMPVMFGPPGCGKSSLVEIYARCLGINPFGVYVSSALGSSADLLGYRSLLSERPQFRSSGNGLYERLAEAQAKASERMHMICFEEMNLSPVESYFSDFMQLLSRSPDDHRQFPGVPLNPDDMTGENYLTWGRNALLVGTLNADPTAAPLSDRFRDRVGLIHVSGRRNKHALGNSLPVDVRNIRPWKWDEKIDYKAALASWLTKPDSPFANGYFSKWDSPVVKSLPYTSSVEGQPLKEKLLDKRTFKCIDDVYAEVCRLLKNELQIEPSYRTDLKVRTYLINRPCRNPLSPEEQFDVLDEALALFVLPPPGRMLPSNGCKFLEELLVGIFGADSFSAAHLQSVCDTGSIL